MKTPYNLTIFPITLMNNVLVSILHFPPCLALIGKRSSHTPVTLVHFLKVTYKFINSFIQTISIALLQVHYYSEALPTQQGWQGYCAGVSCRSAIRNSSNTCRVIELMQLDCMSLKLSVAV